MNWLHRILRDPECRGNIICFMAAFVLVFWSLAFFVYAMARFSATDFKPIAELQRRSDHNEYEIQWLTNEVVSIQSELMEVQ